MCSTSIPDPVLMYRRCMAEILQIRPKSFTINQNPLQSIDQCTNVLNGVLEAPARCIFQNMVQFNCFYECMYCKMPGKCPI